MIFKELKKLVLTENCSPRDQQRHISLNCVGTDSSVSTEYCTYVPNTRSLFGVMFAFLMYIDTTCEVHYLTPIFHNFTNDSTLYLQYIVSICFIFIFIFIVICYVMLCSVLFCSVLMYDTSYRRL